MKNNIRIALLLLSAIFAASFLTGCYEEDNPHFPNTPDTPREVKVSESHDALSYDKQAGHYDLVLELLTDSFSYETVEYVYDKIAKSEVEFGDSDDKMARFKIPVNILGYIVDNEEYRNSLLNSDEQILIETPYTIRLWNFSDYKNINTEETKYDCQFSEVVNGFAFNIEDKQYVLSIRIANMKRQWRQYTGYNSANWPDVIDGIGFYYVKLLCNGQEVPLAYNGHQLDGNSGDYPFKFVGNWLGDHHPFSVFK